MIMCKRPDPPDANLKEVRSSGWSFARGWILRIIICKRQDLLDDHLQQRQQQRQWPSRLPQGAYFPIHPSSRQCIITLLLPRKVMDPKPQSQNLSAIPKVSGKGVPPPPKDLLPKTAFLYPYASFRPFFGALWLWTSPWRAQKYIKKLNLYDNTFQSLAEILHQHHVGFVNGCNYCRGTEMNYGNVG